MCAFSVIGCACACAYLRNWDAELKLFIGYGSEMVRGRSRDRCQRQNDSVITAVPRGRVAQPVFLLLIVWQPLFACFVFLHAYFDCECAIYGRRAFGCRRILFLPWGHFCPQLGGACPYPVPELEAKMEEKMAPFLHCSPTDIPPNPTHTRTHTVSGGLSCLWGFYLLLWVKSLAETGDVVWTHGSCVHDCTGVIFMTPLFWCSLFSSGCTPDSVWSNRGRNLFYSCFCSTC